jgi:transposase InsO family protein
MDKAVKIYFNPKHWASLGGIKTLQRAVKKKPDLSKYRAYTLHRPARKRMSKYRPYRAAAYGYQLQADLNDMIQLKDQNDGYQYILTVIDVFTRYAWALPLKTKGGEDITNAFRIIFKDVNPIYLQTDKGKEFYNSAFDKFLKSKKCKLFSVYSPHKAALVERFNRTLKTRMYRYFTHNNTQNWVKVLPDLISSYNNHRHSSIKMSPIEAKKKKNWWKISSSREIVKSRHPKLNVGNLVRISKTKGVFEKGYKANWSEQIFVIHDIDRKEDPPMYTIKDYKGEIIEGKFYKQELQKVQKPDNYPIEKIYETQKNWKLVKFVGYPEKYWVKNVKNRLI